MKIKNRSASVVVYSIPDLNIRRRFAPGEIKEISKEEITKLMYQPGGHRLLMNYLQASKEDIKQLDVVEPEREYFYSDDEIKNLMKFGPLDEFLDALDWAPEGIIDLFKEYAITLPLTDTQKIEALREKTGFDAGVALKNLKDTQIADSASETIEPVRKRRVSDEAATATATTGRYNIISTNN